ncbi:hypothetical protein C8Q78DRAFT_1072385 [Trametes maxima]|nr:hypothetical protein C8Q78DRAFT_1072385 [Trametes maxima]
MDGEASDHKHMRHMEILEVEDEEERQERMQSLLSRLNSFPSNSSSTGTLAPPRPFDFGDRSTLTVAPPLELLSRVQAFLPELAASNAELARRAREDPESVDIENLGEDQQQYIEMNLGLGVFDHRGDLPSGIPVADVDLDARMADPSSSSESDTDDSSTSSDDSSDSSGLEDESPSEVDSDLHIDASPGDKDEPRPKRPLPRRKAPGGKKPEIVVLSETPCDPASST